MALGRVKWFNDSKGFGIIETVDGTEIFVHYTEIETEGYRTLREGQSVEFDWYETQRGNNARRVRYT